MTRRVSPRLRLYCALSGSALLAGLVSGRPELVALAAPLLTFVTVGLLVSRPPDVTGSVLVGRERALEGEALPLTITLTNRGRRSVQVEAVLGSPRSATLNDQAGRVVQLAPGEIRELAAGLAVARWGIHQVGPGELTVRHPLGLFTWTRALRPAGQVRVYPRPERLRELVAPLRTQMLSGNRVSRLQGEGIEFADIRSFQPGDRLRRVNWRVSARRGELYVNQQHPERNADVILFVDSFEEARSAAGGTLDMALRAAVTLAEVYLQRRDRVGVVSFGGVLRWLEPSLGPRAVYRIVDALLQTSIVFSYVWRTVDVIPSRLLPPGSLVVALTPLLDARAIAALADLRRRGYDLAIVECVADPFVAPSRTGTEETAWHLWSLGRDATRRRLRQLGIPVVSWRPDAPLASPIEEVIRSRRHARPRQLV